MRTKPYTEIGISRVLCARCGKPSRYQWQICADRRAFRGLCTDCDIELNTMVMRWVWGDAREADIAAYAESARA
jgi:hypothetical protein